MPFSLVVEGLVEGSVRVGEHHGGIHDHGGRRELPGVDGRRIVQRLEGGSRLDLRLGGAVELVRAGELPASHHGEDVAVGGVDGDQGALHLGLARHGQARVDSRGHDGLRLLKGEQGRDHLHDGPHLPGIVPLGVSRGVAVPVHQVIDVEGKPEHVDEGQVRGVGRRDLCPGAGEVEGVHLVDVLRHALVRFPLVVEVERGVHDEAVGEIVVGSDQKVFQLAPDVLAEVGRLVFPVEERAAVRPRVVVLCPVLVEGVVRLLL